MSTLAEFGRFHVKFQCFRSRLTFKSVQEDAHFHGKFLLSHKFVRFGSFYAFVGFNSFSKSFAKSVYSDAKSFSVDLPPLCIGGQSALVVIHGKSSIFPISRKKLDPNFTEKARELEEALSNHFQTCSHSLTKFNFTEFL